MLAFAVLRAPDIPSALVETAFISNPEEELKLRSAAHQLKLARQSEAASGAFWRRSRCGRKVTVTTI